EIAVELEIQHRSPPLAAPAPSHAELVRADRPAAKEMPAVARLVALVANSAEREKPVGVVLEALIVHIEARGDSVAGDAPGEIAAVHAREAQACRGAGGRCGERVIVRVARAGALEEVSRPMHDAGERCGA